MGKKKTVKVRPSRRIDVHGRNILWNLLTLSSCSHKIFSGLRSLCAIPFQIEKMTVRCAACNYTGADEELQRKVQNGRYASPSEGLLNLPLVCRKSSALAMSCTTMLASCSLKWRLLWMWFNMEPARHSKNSASIKTSAWCRSNMVTKSSKGFVLVPNFTGHLYPTAAINVSNITSNCSHLPWAFQTQGKIYPLPQRILPTPKCSCKEAVTRISTVFWKETILRF